MRPTSTHPLRSRARPGWSRQLHGPSRAGGLLLVTALVAACGEDAPDIVEPPVDEVAEVNELVTSLGTWEDFAKPKVEEDIAKGDASIVEEIVGQTTYQCTVEPRSLTTTPDQIVMYEPNDAIMWVGNLLQGDSYVGGQGSFEELSIRQRAPLKISIDLLTGNNFAIVDNPSLTSVRAAIGELIQRATDAGHRSGSSITYDSWRLSSTVEAIQRAGLSANFMYSGVPVELGAEAGWELDASMTGVFAHFTQKMFTISIELPQSPSDFFSDELTPALLQQQVDAGNIGPNNLPVYIASITYGRTLSYTLFSADTESKLHAAVRASMDGLGSAEIESGLHTTLSSDRLRATAIGGEGQNVIDMIRDGELSSYFTTDAPLTSAKPLSYQLNFLGNNSIAKISETTEYDLRTCNEKAVSPGLFDFAQLQSEASGVSAPYSVLQGDLDGDGLGDLVLSHLQSGVNQTRIGLGQPSGAFAFGSTIVHTESPTEGWADNYTTHVGDFDGDGYDDVVWDRAKTGSPRRVHVGLSDGSGGLQLLAPQQIGTGNWATEWETLVGNVDGDADDDLIFNYRDGSANYVYIGLANGDGTFTLGPSRQEHPTSGNWDDYEVFVADVDGGTQRDDIIWNYTSCCSAPNSVFLALSDGDGTLTFNPWQGFLHGWEGYQSRVGDIDGDGRADLVWAKTLGATFSIHRALGQGSGAFELRSGSQGYSRDTGLFGDSGDVPVHMGDFNGDGRDDLLFNLLDAGNALKVALGGSSGDFAFTPAAQPHSATGEDWTQYQVRVLDVTGEGLDDVVWVRPTPTLRIYVATARQ